MIPHSADEGTTDREINGETPRAYAIRRAGELGINRWRLLGSKRDLATVDVRTTIARELRAQPWGLSFVAIGKVLNRHHTSIMNLCGAFDWDETRLKNGRFARALHFEAERVRP